MKKVKCMKITDEQLTEIRSVLYRGAIKEIAQKSGRSITYVHSVLHGKYEAPEILTIIIQVFHEHKAKRAEVEKLFADAFNVPTENLSNGLSPKM